MWKLWRHKFNVYQLYWWCYWIKPYEKQSTEQMLMNAFLNAI